MAPTATTTIPRTPQDCDADIKAVCDDVKLNNNLGNQLDSYTVTSDKIILIYK